MREFESPTLRQNSLCYNKNMSFDEEFLEKAGINRLAEGARDEFLARIQEELERRVGEEIYRRCSKKQLREFAGIERGEEEVLRELLQEYSGYEDDKLFKYILGKQEVKEEIEKEKNALREYLKAKMIKKYCPDVTEVVKKQVEEMKEEILAKRAEIVAMAE